MTTSPDHLQDQTEDEPYDEPGEASAAFKVAAYAIAALVSGATWVGVDKLVQWRLL